MNIAERATVLATDLPRSEVLLRAQEAAIRIGMTEADELVPGCDAVWLLAAALVRSKINGDNAPRIFTRVMDDEINVKDGLGG